MELGYLISPIIQIIDNNGNLAVGAKIYVYNANTTALATTYNDFEGHLNTNPVITDTLGNCTIIVDNSRAYDIVVNDENDNPMFSKKNVTMANGVAPSADITFNEGYGIDITRAGNVVTIAADTDFIATQDDLTGKQNKLYAGSHIDIDENDTISVTGLKSLSSVYPVMVDETLTTQKIYLDNDWTSSVSAAYSAGTDIKIESGVISVDTNGYAEPNTTSFVAGYGTSAGNNCSFAAGVNSVASGNACIAFGNGAVAYGDGAYAEGNATYSDARNGLATHAEGSRTSAIGNEAHAEGYSTIASGDCTHAEGSYAIASGTYSHAEGNSTTAEGGQSHAEGNETKAAGYNSHAEGQFSTAFGNAAHAEGYMTSADGHAAHAEGFCTLASGSEAHAEGYYSIASGDYSHAEGNNTSAYGQSTRAAGDHTLASGAGSVAEGWYNSAYNYSHAEGGYTRASGNFAHAEGYATTASSDYSHTEGYQALASGNYSHAEGMNTHAYGQGSHAECYNTYAVGYASHAEGTETYSNGDYSHAEGYATKSNGPRAHAEGNTTSAIGSNAHAEGNYTMAYRDNTHAEGDSTSAMTVYAHVGGKNSIAAGSASFAHGENVKTSGDYSVAFGKDNNVSGKYDLVAGFENRVSGNFVLAAGHGIVSNSGSNVIGTYNVDTNDVFVVGGGTNDSSRKNLFRVGPSGCFFTYNNTEYQMQPSTTKWQQSYADIPNDGTTVTIKTISTPTDSFVIEGLYDTATSNYKINIRNTNANTRTFTLYDMQNTEVNIYGGTTTIYEGYGKHQFRFTIYGMGSGNNIPMGEYILYLLQYTTRLNVHIYEVQPYGL